MQISVSDAKAQLTELVRRAQDGEEIVLTWHGQPIARIAPILQPISADQRRRAIAEARAASSNARAGPCAARSQDFLFGDGGHPA